MYLMIIRLDEGVIAFSAGGPGDEFTKGIVEFGVSIFAAVFMVFAMIAFEVASSESVFFFDWEACSCWPTIALDCHDLQALMPSYHV